jgi:hypothetical protein
MSVLGVIAWIALFVTRGIPTTQPAAEPEPRGRRDLRRLVVPVRQLPVRPAAGRRRMANRGAPHSGQ